MRTPNPKSVSGQLRKLVAERPITTREAAERFGKTSAVMSALLNQMRQRGEVVQLSRGSKGVKTGKPAIWGAPE